ncbi:MAG TPA: hypothetical protein VEK11_26725 [Thermoanaerobaculia bacterium]|nr:hypothetical protein [Thermoanaerobaculia bacterium]
MTRRDGLWFVAYFAAALLPRLSPLLSGAVFSDDLIHVPAGHLLSYRFLNYLELGFWQTVFGPAYLLGSAPQIIASFYTAALCSAIRAVLRSWAGVPRLEFSVLALLIPLHPLWNTFISWHVTGVYALSLFLIVIGYALLASRPMAGVLLIALGVSGYQVHLGLVAPLLFAELSLRKTPLVRRVLQCGAAAALYVIATKIAALAGLTTWGGRGMGLAASFHPLTNNLAVIAQPLLSFYVSVEAAWRGWSAIFAILALIAAIHRPRRWAPAPLVLPVAAAAVVLATNAPDSGPRMAAAIWIATLLAAIHSRAATIALVVFTLLALPVTLTDAENRTRGWRADQRILALLPAGAPVAIVRSSFDDPPLPPEWQSRPIVMQDFQAVTPFSYSNVHTQPEWFFGRFGHPIVPPAPGVVTIDRTTLRVISR